MLLCRTLDTKQKNFKKETDTTEDDLFKLHRKQMTGVGSRLTVLCCIPNLSSCLALPPCVSMHAFMQYWITCSWH